MYSETRFQTQQILNSTYFKDLHHILRKNLSNGTPPSSLPPPASSANTLL